MTQRSHSVGLVVTSFADPFHSAVAQGVEEEARQQDFSIFLASTDLHLEQIDRSARSKLCAVFRGARWMG
ncbi:MAG: hypothetical protein R3E79_29310 [Caldilineaceae bacterium]